MRVLTITGKSGGGKTVLFHGLHREYGVGRIPSAVTRAERPSDGENENVFYTLDEFHALTDLIRSVNLHGNWYGTRSSHIFEHLGTSPHGIASLITTPNCHDLIRNWCLRRGIECSGVHLLSPGDDELMQRQINRDGDKAKARARLDDAADWDKFAAELSHVDLVEPQSIDATRREVAGLLGLAP